MRSIGDIAAEIVAREGGYVNDPDDPGGATKHGVTLGTLRRLDVDVDGDGDADLDDLKALTPDQAARIFITHYHDAPGIGRLPEVLRASVFDMQVNAGAQAVMILQRLLGQMGYPLEVDGQIGPKTAAAAADAAAVDAVSLFNAYGIARRNYYLGLADRRPNLRKFARTRAGGKGGWIRRAEAFIDPAYHMDEAAFARRVAAWG